MDVKGGGGGGGGGDLITGKLETWNLQRNGKKKVNIDET